ncbi:MAG: NAD-dependent epimerase/dehydratase family protein [Deltaproteobacteria bacterium]|nr:NAD-dependent epimerase/dehydratase family protein [Deltaproteobacteria bacterium]
MTEKGRVLVTGGAGFIGSHLAKKLIQAGYHVFVIDNLSTGRRSNIPEAAEFIELDLSLTNSLDELQDLHLDAIFHLAAQSSGALSFVDPHADLRSHIYSTFNLLQYCLKFKVNRFLYASSATVYGDPLYLPVDENHPKNPKTYYAAGKIASEAYVNLFNSLGVNTTILRMPNVYGPGQNLENKNQGMVSIYLSYMLGNSPIVVKGLPTRFRDFIYIDDVINAWMKAQKAAEAYGKIYNLASGEKSLVEDILKELVSAFDIPQYPIVYDCGTPGDQTGMVCDISRISEDLNWNPEIDLKIGIKKTVEFERRRWNSGKS